MSVQKEKKKGRTEPSRKMKCKEWKEGRERRKGRGKEGISDKRKGRK